MQYQATQMANFKVGIILLYMIIITIHTPLVPQNANKLIKGGDYNVLLYSMLLVMSTNSLPIYIYIYIYIGFLVEHYNKEEGKWKKEKRSTYFSIKCEFYNKNC